ncbi:uncharacterized protein LOC109600735 [Aethina tumida]|uniref:uncharacterized protein LOC109600735 n=1 Tax=Aethina tumida TaxID=116153 RepID=UPI0021485FCD|nr:uncharacterized protein LOC109600735 [Aethina tumida]
MSYYFFCVLCALCSVLHYSAEDAPAAARRNANISSMSVYYDPKSRLPFRITSIENSLMNTFGSNDQSSTKTRGLLRRVGFRSNGCTCQTLTCGCCLGFNFDQFNFNREGCMNFTYDPDDFSVNMNMLMDENSVFSSTFSAKNPPPLCLPLPIPYLPLSMDVCAKLFDIRTPGRNLHMCLDFETRIESASLLVLHFDCMRMGTDGLALTKPGDTLPTPGPTTESQVNPDIYDEVTEIKYHNKPL